MSMSYATDWPGEHIPHDRMGRYLVLFAVLSVALHVAAALVGSQYSAWRRARYIPPPVVTPVRIISADRLSMKQQVAPRAVTKKAAPATTTKRVRTKPKAKPDPNAAVQSSLEQYLEQLEETVTEDEEIEIPPDAWMGEADGVAEGTAEDGGLVIKFYGDEVGDILTGNGSAPPNAEERGLQAVVEITITRDGTIQNPRFTSPSGDTTFDDSIHRALAKSSPLPPLPADYRSPTWTHPFLFDPRDAANASRP